MKSFEQLIFALYVLLFMGLIYYSTSYSMQLQESRMTQLQQEDIDKRMQEDSLIVESAKYRGFIKHDGDPATNLYDIKLDASNSTDNEKDNMTYSWTQINGNKLDFPFENKDVQYLQAPAGEYTFKLDVADAYGLVASDTQTVVIGQEPNLPPEALLNIINESKPVYFKKGPEWQNIPDSVTAFQTKHKLVIDGKWGPASQKRFLKIASDKKSAKDKAEKKAADKEKAAKDKAAKNKAAKNKAAKDKVMKEYTDKLTEIESKIQQVESGKLSRNKKKKEIAKLEDEKAAHIKTKPR